MIHHKKVKRNTVFVNKERSSCLLPIMRLQSEDVRKEKEKQDELDAIDELIKKRASNRKAYSRSHVNTYTPLTKMQKVKVLEDMDESSSNRFKQYSDIFDKIKEQISDINTSLTGSFAETNNKDSNTIVNKVSNRKVINIHNCDNIEEREDEDFISPKYVVKTLPTYSSDYCFDMETLNENKKAITTRESLIKSNSVLLLQSKKKRDCRMSTCNDTEHSVTFIKAKEEFNKVTGSSRNYKYKSGNTSDIEGSHLLESNHSRYDSKLYEVYDKKDTEQSPTCNCIIQ